MPVYAIGDVQGCYDQLRQLLDRLSFDPTEDRLWFVGDLVNRGPQSLPVLRYVRGLGEAALTVLGNHDLHLLARAVGVDRRKRKDTIDDILNAPDAGELLDWLRHRPLLHHEPGMGTVLVHAGLLPQWDVAQALALAGEVQDLLRGSDYAELFMHMYGDEPDRWDEGLSGWARARIVINTFTRLRYCEPGGRMDLEPKGAPGSQGAGLVPWYAVPGRRSNDTRIVFGHWSTLGYREEHNVVALDTGCVWGGSLTAARIDAGDIAVTQQACPHGLFPGTRA